MLVKEAQKLLKPYDIVMIYDKTLKMYKVFLGAGFVYITKEKMKGFDALSFQEFIIEASIKDSIIYPIVTLQ